MMMDCRPKTLRSSCGIANLTHQRKFYIQILALIWPIEYWNPNSEGRKAQSIFEMKIFIQKLYFMNPQRKNSLPLVNFSYQKHKMQDLSPTLES